MSKIELLPQEVIRRKRENLVLERSDLKYFFDNYLQGKVADYQVSALLMAGFLRGFNAEETASLTEIMFKSGKMLNWNSSMPVVDKHSTGGVGDKTTLVLGPLMALEGVIMPTIAGRGLGHTGGTIDKLESIPGFKTRLDLQTGQRLAEKHGCVFLGQSDDIAPLDRRLYALRDVTATVESVAFITASILSKKLAEGLDGIFFDVKVGSGAFMDNLQKARELALSLKTVAEKTALPKPLKATCLITSMDSPLGTTAGNLHEAEACFKILRGEKVDGDTLDLTLTIAEHMLTLAKKPFHRPRLEEHLASGRAWEKFVQVAVDQGADARWLENPSNWNARLKQTAYASKESGYISEINVRALGLALIQLGAGRSTAEDTIDHAVGLSLIKNVGDEIQVGEPFCVIEGRDPDRIDRCLATLQDAFKVSREKTSFKRVIEKI